MLSGNANEREAGKRLDLERMECSSTGVDDSGCDSTMLDGYEVMDWQQRQPKSSAEPAASLFTVPRDAFGGAMNIGFLVHIP